MKVEYTRENSGNYMELHDDIQDCFEMKMISCNNINGILPVSTRELNNQKIYMYNITGKNNISEIYNRKKMNADELHMLIECLHNIINGMESYLLNASGLKLEPELIYKDINDEKYYFAYYLNDDTMLWDNLKRLFEYIIGVIDHNDNEAVTIAYGVYKRLCINQTSIDELFVFERKKEEIYEVQTREIIEENIIPEIKEEEKEITDRSKIYATYLGFAVLALMTIGCVIKILIGGENNRTFWGILFVICVSSILGLYLWTKKYLPDLVKIKSEKVLIPYSNENVRIILPDKKQDNLTTILNAKNVLVPRLEWQEKGILRYYSVEEDMVIGSSAELADCVINERGVSRVHAKIICEENNYYVKDMNSTNGTKVNGNQLVSYQMMPIHKEDIINIGSVNVLFH